MPYDYEYRTKIGKVWSDWIRVGKRMRDKREAVARLKRIKNDPEMTRFIRERRIIHILRDGTDEVVE